MGSADPTEIDRINIHQASLRAMQRAVLALAPLPDIVLVDAFRVPDLPMAQRGVPHGDRRCSAIAAASIVAKVTRDRLMRELHGRDPRYGFDRHKGYATADHIDAVARFGYSDAHRRSFRPATLFDTMISLFADVRRRLSDCPCHRGEPRQLSPVSGREGGADCFAGDAGVRRPLLEVGLLLVVLPWSGFWDRNYFEPRCRGCGRSSRTISFAAP